MPQQEENERQQLQQTLNQLQQIKPETLVRREDLGKDLHFESGLDYFRRTLSLCETLATTQLDGVPLNVLQQLHTQAKQTLTYLKQIQEFDPKQHQNPFAQRDQLVNQVRDHYNSHLYPISSPVIAFGIRRGTDFAELERQARAALSTVETERAEINQVGHKLREDAEAILSTMRRAAAEMGVAQQSIHFADQARMHAKESRKWLITSIAISGAILIFAVVTFAFNWPPAPANVSETAGLIKYLAFRVIILSILLYGLVWSSRNYRAHRHNEIVNRHRQTALITFETFVKAAGDAETKNAVLLQATQSIFAPQSSGYLTTEPEPFPQSTVVEILRRFTSEK
jgi:hypothetical protein